MLKITNREAQLLDELLEELGDAMFLIEKFGEHEDPILEDGKYIRKKEIIINKLKELTKNIGRWVNPCQINYS